MIFVVFRVTWRTHHLWQVHGLTWLHGLGRNNGRVDRLSIKLQHGVLEPVLQLTLCQTCHPSFHFLQWDRVQLERVTSKLQGTYRPTPIHAHTYAPFSLQITKHASFWNASRQMCWALVHLLSIQSYLHEVVRSLHLSHQVLHHLLPDHGVSRWHRSHHAQREALHGNKGRGLLHRLLHGSDHLWGAHSRLVTFLRPL